MERQNKSNWEGTRKAPILMIEGTNGIMYEFADKYAINPDKVPVSEAYQGYQTKEAFDLATSAGTTQFLPHL